LTSRKRRLYFFPRGKQQKNSKKWGKRDAGKEKKRLLRETRYTWDCSKKIYRTLYSLRGGREGKKGGGKIKGEKVLNFVAKTQGKVGGPVLVKSVPNFSLLICRLVAIEGERED